MEWNAQNHQADRDFEPLKILKRNLAAWNLCHFKPAKSRQDAWRNHSCAKPNQVQWPKPIKIVGWCGIPSANITRLALRPVSCPRLDSCGPSRCSNSFRRAAYDAANARCGAPRFHVLATSSAQDGTENARCGSARGTSAVGVGGTRE